MNGTFAHPLHGSWRIALAASCVFAMSFAALPASATERAAETDSVSTAASGDALIGLSLEDLANVQVTTASKKEEPWFRIPAAVYVLTGDDLRRSGVRSIPEALRMVPGLEVAEINQGMWAVGARGFNARFSTNLLVLVDGHSIYTPLFTGVFWDAEETLLDDIERIEVIRGPGATLWGANAVNGVINIITKDSGDSQGRMLTAAGGNVEKGFVGARVGGAMGTTSTFRVYGLGFRRQAFPSAFEGLDANDWDGGRGGFRLDWNPGPRDHLTLGGSAISNSEPQILAMPELVPPYSSMFTDDATHLGQSLLARWSRTTSARSEASVQVNYDHTDRTEVMGHWRRHTLDVDVQHNYTYSPILESVWGASYRTTHDRLSSEYELIGFSKERSIEERFGAFAQYGLHTRDGRVALTVGTKIEKPTYADAELQPNVRVAFAPASNQTLWGSVSRALRTPSRGERTVALGLLAFPDPMGSGLTIVPTLIGNPDLPNEVLIAFEAGYRARVASAFTADLAVYHHRYSSQRSVEVGTPALAFAGATPYLRMPILERGNDEVNGDGAELALWTNPLPNWRVRAGYTYALLKREGVGTSALGSVASSSFPPRHSGYLESMVDLHRQWSAGGTLRYVDNLPATTVGAYTELDARLFWRPVRELQLGALGNNLLHERHAEFRPEVLYRPGLVERSYLLLATTHF